MYALQSLLPCQDRVLGSLVFYKQSYIALVLYSHGSIYVRIFLDLSDKNLPQICIVRKRKLLAYITSVRKGGDDFSDLNVIIRAWVYFLSLSLPFGSIYLSFQCRRFEFVPWVRKIPWRREWQPIPVFLLGGIPCTEKSGRLQTLGSQKCWTQHSN